MSRPDSWIGDPRRFWIAATLVALVLALLAQLVRVFMPLAFEIGEQIGGTTGYLTAGAVALVVFAAPAIAAIGGIAGGGRAALVGSVAAIALARVGIQLVHPIPVWLGTVAVAIGLAALPVVVGPLRRTAGDAALLVGVLLGLALDTAIRTGFLTWDPAWQDGAGPLIFVVALSATAVAAALAIPVVAGPSATPPALRLAAFGPFLALQLLFLQSPAAVASHAELSMAAASATVLAIDAVALAVGSLRVRIGPVFAVALALLAATGAFLLRETSGSSAIALFAAEQLALVLLLGRALIEEPVRAERPDRLAGACALGSLAFAGIVFAYQVNNEVPLGFPIALVPAVAAAVVGLAAIPRRGTVPARVPRIAMAVPVALLSVPAIVGASAPAFEVSPPDDGSVRVVSYNIHGGVNVDGVLDPETTARVIEDQDPDVVVLNEVARGWPIFGGLDAAEWLSRRLEMPYLYEPAADRQFGNAILSRLPILEASGGELPFGHGPQQRSYVVVRVDAGDGRELTVIGTHLQSSEDPATRSDQVDVLLDVWGGSTPAVIAGDMNMQPDEEDDVRRFLDAGLVSVQDEIGDPCEPTAFEPKPDEPCDRPDWIFATPDLDLSEFDIVRTPASDHLPLAVTVTLAP